VKCLDATLLDLHAFEALPGIKINFGKTELILVNLPSEEAQMFAALADCKLSQFPLNYLGVPLSDKKLSCSEWNGVIEKVQRKLPNWKGALLSIGGRLVLINSVLSSTPLYMLSLYKMPVKIKIKLDSIRCHFLWQSTSTKKRFALIKWTKICMPRQFGGLGILDLHCMNISLLLKWW
jgi:hypothetical protein